MIHSADVVRNTHNTEKYGNKGGTQTSIPGTDGKNFCLNIYRNVIVGYYLSRNVYFPHDYVIHFVYH